VSLLGYTASPYAPLRKRGISDEVINARGYVPYFGRRHPLYDPEAVGRVLADFDFAPGQRRTLMKFMADAVDTDAAPLRDAHKGCGQGLVMPKYPFPGQAQIAHQLRPEYDVDTGGKYRHRHDHAFGGNAKGLRRHLDKEHGDWWVVDDDEYHVHANWAKYLLCPKAKIDTEHDHVTDPRFQGKLGKTRLKQHLGKWHRKGGEHDHQVHGTHVHRRPAPGQNIANRLDVNPLAIERLADAKRIYFVLEGALKADSVLTRILDRDAKASVFNVPSVTLWKAPELERVAKTWLQGLAGQDPLVVIVCDADAHEKSMVMRQALLCREYLRRLGVKACVAAPPADRDENGELLYKGVDDFLAAGGELDDLVVIDRESEFALALFANPDGRLCSTISGLMPILRCGRNPKRVIEALWEHINTGRLTSNRSLELEEDEWTGALRWKGRREDRPTFTVSPGLRYTESLVRLGEYTYAGKPLTVSAVFEDEYTRALKDDLLVTPHTLRGAVEATAQRLGVAKRTVRDDPYVAGHFAWHHWWLGYVVPMAREVGFTLSGCANLFGVSVNTVRELLNDPPSFPFDTEEKIVQETLIPTDGQLAGSAVKLAEVAGKLQSIIGELRETATQLEQRFPTDAAVKGAVNDLLASLR
jgi:hypothetical protein